MRRVILLVVVILFAVPNLSFAANKMFVGGLAWSTNNNSLKAFAASCAGVAAVDVKAKVVLDRATGRSRGFGFVEFKDSVTDGTFAECLAYLKVNSQLDGRNVKVTEAQDRGGSGGRGGRKGSAGKGGGGGRW